MPEIIHGLDVAIGIVRLIFIILVVIAAVLATLDWLVRTRRIEPFGPVARFTRATVDPLIAPIERTMVRAGGTPASAPWWALLFLIVVGALLIGILGFVRSQLVMGYYAAGRGPRGILQLVVGWTFAILQIALLVRVVLSWVGGTYSRIGRVATALTEWFLAPLRRVLPTIGAIDISPLVAWFALVLLQGVVTQAL